MAAVLVCDRGCRDVARFFEASMTEFVMVVLALIPLDVLPDPPTPTPSAVHSSSGPGSRRLHPWWLFRPRHPRAGDGPAETQGQPSPPT